MLSKKALLENQAQFWELIRQGKTNTAACKAVGVDRRQGLRWRTTVGGTSLVRPAAASGRYLSLDERLRIADLAITGASLSEMAVELADAVVDAREHGHTWAQIAAMLGTSRQAAQERYGESAERP